MAANGQATGISQSLISGLYFQVYLSIPASFNYYIAEFITFFKSNPVVTYNGTTATFGQWTPTISASGDPRLNVTQFGLNSTQASGAFAMQFTGYILPTVSGAYTFKSYIDNYMYMWIGSSAANPRVFNTKSNIFWELDCCSWQTSPSIPLTAGVYYPILIYYANGSPNGGAGGPSGLEIGWMVPGQTDYTADGTGFFVSSLPTTSGLSYKAYNNFLGEKSVDNLYKFISTNRNPTGTRSISAIPFPWPSNPSYIGFPDRTYGTSITPAMASALQITGVLMPTISGKYIFKAFIDDDMALWLGASAATPGSSNTSSNVFWTQTCCSWQDSPPVQLQAGVSYPILIYYVNYGGSAAINIGWMPPGQTTFASIPSSALYQSVSLDDSFKGSLYKYTDQDTPLNGYSNCVPYC